MRFIHHTLLGSSAVAIALCAGQPALAQATQQDEAALPASAENEIVVTAARHTQSLQKVSASVDVVGGEDLARTATTNVSQALAAVPGVNTSVQPGGFSINVRGLGADLQSGTTQGSVALEFDGVYNVISLGTATGFFDVDRIEVLKGPQSTRYGPNAEGGVVNVISNDPVLGSNAGNGLLTIGNYGLIRGEIAQNIALTDTLAIRIAGTAVRRNSYFDPDTGNNIAQSVRAKILFRPSDAFSVKLSYQLDHLGGTGYGSEASYPVVVNKVAPYSGDSINDNGNPWHKGDTGDATSDPANNKADVTQQTFTGNVSYGFSDFAALDVTGSYIKITGDETSCAHNGPPWNIGGAGQCFAVHEYDPFNQYSAEVRLHSPDGSPVQWNLGYYYWDYSQYKWGEAFQAVPGREGGIAYGTRTNAIFGEVTYPVSDSLRAIAGARESWDRRKLKPAAVDTTYTDDLSHFDFRLGEEFDLSPNSMQYFTVSSGYRPGGLTYNGALGTAESFASEKTLAFEFGLKNRFFDRRLLLNVDAFYYKQKDYQDIDSYAGFPVTLADGSSYVCSNGGGQPAECSVPTFNIKNAYNLGLEWQARFLLTPNDVIGFNGTLMKARFGKNQGTCATLAAPTGGGCYIGYNDQLTNALLFYDIRGKVQPHSPTFSTNISYEHSFHLHSGATFTLGGDAYHSSGYWVHPVQDAAKLGYQPSYWQENLQARFTTADERFTLSAYIKNLSNYAVKLSTLPATTISDPRTFGATLGVRW